MRMNLSWNDALAAAASEFPADTQRAAWPPALTIGQIAALQRPFNDEDGAGRKAYAVLYLTLATACALDEIESSKATTEQITPARYIKGRTKPTWDEPPKATLRIVPESKKLFHHTYITAATFAAWLADQGEQPSAHIRAWVQANGVSLPEVRPAALVQGATAAPGEAVTAAPATGAALVPPAAAPARIVKRAALVAELQGEWPTIELDLNDTGRNGLKAAAGTSKRGYWRVEAARQWAEENHKLGTTPKRASAALVALPWDAEKTISHRIR